MWTGAWHPSFLLFPSAQTLRWAPNRRCVRIDRKFRTRVNFHIRVPEVRVVDSDGEQLGVMETLKAIAIAEEQGFDLVEVSPTARPPVCRIMDYGKFKYEKNKREKQSKKKQHVVQVKEIKLRPKTEEHDFQFKKRHAEEFLTKHNRVKFTVIFRGRELDRKEMGRKLLTKMEAELMEVGFVERSPQFEGRLMTMYMAPHPAKPGAQPKKEKSKGEKPPARAKKPAPAAESAPADESVDAAATADTGETSEGQAPEDGTSTEKEVKDA